MGQSGIVLGVRSGLVEMSCREKILELHNIQLTIGTTNVASGFRYLFQKEDKVGLVGENGTGKTTFIKMLLKTLEPDTGKVVWGETLRIGYYAQEQGTLDNSKRILECVRDVADWIPLKKGLQLSAAPLLH